MSDFEDYEALGDTEITLTEFYAKMETKIYEFYLKEKKEQKQRPELEGITMPAKTWVGWFNLFLCNPEHKHPDLDLFSY